MNKSHPLLLFIFLLFLTAGLQAQDTIQREIEQSNTYRSVNLEQPLTQAAPRPATGVFGSELFNNPNITFSPNMNMPTPPNYVLSAGDEVIVDIYGYSEATYRLVVSPEGNLRIPMVGVVPVNGLTMEQARSRITDYLARNGYANIRSGSTKVNITLGNIRSIRVMIIGEATAPGTYTLPSLATVYTALYASGGPNVNGSYRTIELIRNSRKIATIDVYDFLMNGDKSHDLGLLDQDVIKINPTDLRVDLKGAVVRPLKFDLLAAETMDDLIRYAGGFTADAYTYRITVDRKTTREREIKDVTLEEFMNFTPRNGDRYTVGEILDRYSNRVNVEGAVFRPGSFELTPGMRLSDLVRRADGFKEDVYTGTALLYRYNPNRTPAVVTVNMDDVMAGRNDLTLQKDDRLVVYSIFDLRDEYNVTINGAVRNPTSIRWVENLRLRDMLFIGGGLHESASTQIEVARRVKFVDVMQKDAETATITTYDMNDPGFDTVMVRPRDEIMVKPIPGYQPTMRVTLKGEVLHPGTYSIVSSEERLSSLIERAGGYTAAAYPKGAILIRNRSTLVTQPVIDQQMAETMENVTDTLKSDVYTQKVQIARDDRNMVGIDLVKAVRNPGSRFDIILTEGDELSIPKAPQTVSVSGEVFVPKIVQFKPAGNALSYIQEAGGFTENALKRGVYVVYPNGEVRSTRSFLGLRTYPRVVNGSEVFVPAEKPKDPSDRLQKTTAVVSTMTATATLVYLLINIFK